MILAADGVPVGLIADDVNQSGRGPAAFVHIHPPEGHGFQKRENQVDSLRRTVAWFDKYLKGAAQ